MNLQPGCPLVVAPCFHLAVNWPERLLLGSFHPEAGRFLASLDWRTPTAEEQAFLVGDPTRLSREAALREALCLFGLPQHLQATFGAMLEQAGEGGTPCLPGFDRFAQQLAGFLAFKGLSIPEGAVFDLVVSQPGQRSVSWDPLAPETGGLAFNLDPSLPYPVPNAGGPSRLWGAINLGDEAVALHYVNLTPIQAAAEVARQLPEQPAPATISELGQRFLQHCSDYPLVRLRLEPGEGCRAPAEGLLIDASTLDMQGPSVLLLVRPGGGQGA